MDGNSPRATGKSRDFVDWQASSGRDMTYACAFCKRGFSNAQALGGHMNIHRRDRAKLKQAASLDEENLLSLDNTTSIPSDHSSLVSPGNDIRSPGDRISVIKRPEEVSLSVEDARDEKEELQQLPLFVGDKVGLPGNVAGGVKEKKVQSGQDVSSQSQAEVAVDLELRLGPDPYESSGNMD